MSIPNYPTGQQLFRDMLDRDSLDPVIEVFDRVKEVPMQHDTLRRNSELIRAARFALDGVCVHRWPTEVTQQTHSVDQEEPAFAFVPSIVDRTDELYINRVIFNREFQWSKETFEDPLHKALGKLALTLRKSAREFLNDPTKPILPNGKLKIHDAIRMGCEIEKFTHKNYGQLPTRMKKDGKPPILLARSDLTNGTDHMTRIANLANNAANQITIFTPTLIEAVQLGRNRQEKIRMLRAVNARAARAAQRSDGDEFDIEFCDNNSLKSIPPMPPRASQQILDALIKLSFDLSPEESTDFPDQLQILRSERCPFGYTPTKGLPQSSWNFTRVGEAIIHYLDDREILM